jgi:hypothetical protein
MVMRFLFFSILFSLGAFGNTIFAQIDTSSTGKSDNSNIKISSLILGADYSTNTNTFGKFSSFSRQPSISPYVSFYHKSGLLISGLVNAIGNSDSSATHWTYQINLKGGYQFKITDQISFTPSYTRYIYDKNALTISTLYKNYAEANLDMQTKYWFGSIAAGYLWGRIHEFSIEAQTGSSYTWENVFFKDDALMVQVSFSGFFNNPNYLSRLFSFLNNYADANQDATKYNLLVDLLSIANRTPEIKEIRRTFRNDPTLRKMVRNYLPFGISIHDFLNYNNRFTLTSLACSLPVNYMIGNFTLNFDFSIYRSMNQPVYSEQSNYYSYITAGMSYSFNW